MASDSQKADDGEIKFRSQDIIKNRERRRVQHFTRVRKIFDANSFFQYVGDKIDKVPILRGKRKFTVPIAIILGVTIIVSFTVIIITVIRFLLIPPPPIPSDDNVYGDWAQQINTEIDQLLVGGDRDAAAKRIDELITWSRENGDTNRLGKLLEMKAGILSGDQRYQEAIRTYEDYIYEIGPDPYVYISIGENYQRLSETTDTYVNCRKFSDYLSKALELSDKLASDTARYTQARLDANNELCPAEEL